MSCAVHSTHSTPLPGPPIPEMILSQREQDMMQAVAMPAGAKTGL
jgi:hypothetical protein